MEIDFEWNRQRFLKEIAADARRTEAYTGRAAFGERVMAAMGRVPREAFVSDGQRRDAYLNRPLPIGHG